MIILFLLLLTTIVVMPLCLIIHLMTKWRAAHILSQQAQHDLSVLKVLANTMAHRISHIKEHLNDQ